MTDASVETSEDAFLGGRLRLRQLKSGHRVGHDAMLLAAATSARPGARVADFGAGVGAAGLAVAIRVTGIDLVLAELDERLAELARENMRLNGIKAQVCVLDIGSGVDAYAAAGLTPDSLDAILMNPPFNDPARHRSSPNESRRIAHMAEPETLESWIHAARRVLKSSGVLTLIWRGDGLAEVLAALDRGFGSLAILPVHRDLTTPAMRILVRAVKGGRAPLHLCTGLLLNDESGLPNKRVQDILSGNDVLPLALL
jgi:tRNA1(Val) A37 N6-methylase TrmN6